MQNDTWETPLIPPAQAVDTRGDPGTGEQMRQVALIARCLEGDEDAFAFIISQYGNLLLRTAFLLLRDEEEAKDIVQDAFILAWKNLHTLHDPANLRAWLLKIVVNQANSLKRQLMRKSTFLREQLMQSAETDLHQAHVEDHLDLTQAILRLPMSQRIVLVLFYYQKMTMPEISAILGVAENTLRKRLKSALEKIRKVLQNEVDVSKDADMTSEGAHSYVGLERREL